MHILKTASVKSLNNPRPEPQNRPLWLSKELSPQIYCIDSEVDTGSSCNILPLYKVKTLFEEYMQLGPPTVKPIGYNDSSIKNLGSIIVFLCHSNEIYRVLCEVAERSSHMILGRNHTLKMRYVDLPQIQVPTGNAKPRENHQSCLERAGESSNLPSETSHPEITQRLASPSMAKHISY